MKPRSLLLFFPVLLLPLFLSGCYADQRAQLATCEGQAARLEGGLRFTAIKSCMAASGYRFIGLDHGVACDARAVVLGQPSADGSDAPCFEPSGWLARRLYRIEVPIRRS